MLSFVRLWSVYERFREANGSFSENTKYKISQLILLTYLVFASKQQIDSIQIPESRFNQIQKQCKTEVFNSKVRLNSLISFIFQVWEKNKAGVQNENRYRHRAKTGTYMWELEIVCLFFGKENDVHSMLVVRWWWQEILR